MRVGTRSTMSSWFLRSLSPLKAFLLKPAPSASSLLQVTKELWPAPFSLPPLITPVVCVMPPKSLQNSRKPFEDSQKNPKTKSEPSSPQSALLYFFVSPRDLISPYPSWDLVFSQLSMRSSHLPTSPHVPPPDLISRIRTWLPIKSHLSASRHFLTPPPEHLSLYTSPRRSHLPLSPRHAILSLRVSPWDLISLYLPIRLCLPTKPCFVRTWKQVVVNRGIQLKVGVGS